MLHVDQLRCESWNPPLNREEWNTPPHCFPPGRVTKLFAGDRLLSNALELVHWLEPVVYPILCDGCWEQHYYAGDLTRIARTGQHLLWLPPRREDFDQEALARPPVTIPEAMLIPVFDQVDLARHPATIRETMLIPIGEWNRIRQQAPCLPPAESFSQATRREIGAAWLQEIPEALRPDDLTGLGDVAQKALHSDPLPLDKALAGLKQRVEWLLRAPTETVTCRIVPWQGSGRAMNTLYFDGPPFLEWPAFFSESGVDFGLGSQWLCTLA